MPQDRAAQTDFPLQTLLISADLVPRVYPLQEGKVGQKGWELGDISNTLEEAE